MNYKDALRFARLFQQICGALVLASILCASCVVSERNEEDDFLNGIVLPVIVEIPDGNELEVSIENQTLKAHNHADYPVFLPFNPIEGKNEVDYMVYRIQKRDITGQFSDYGESGHYVPSLTSLAPGDYILYPLSIKERGTYRVILSYMVNERIASRINERFTVRQLTKEEESEVDTAYANETSNEIVIH